MGLVEILSPEVKSTEIARWQPFVCSNLCIAIPKGELLNGSIEFASTLGWNTTLLTTTERLYEQSPYSDGKLLKLRQKDIVSMLVSRNIDIGILGADTLIEARLEGKPLQAIKSLGFGACSFYLGFPYDEPDCSPSSRQQLIERLSSCRIATGLPRTLRYILEKSNIPVTQDQIIEMSGSVEAARALSGDIAIADIISSGSTAQANWIRPDFQLCQFPGAYLVRRSLEGGESYG